MSKRSATKTGSVSETQAIVIELFGRGNYGTAPAISSSMTTYKAITNKDSEGNTINFQVINSLTGQVQSTWSTLMAARKVAADLTARS